MKTIFEEQVNAEKSPIIELNAVYPISELRDDTQTVNTGKVTDQTSEYQVRHQAAGDFARITSSSRGRYQPGTVGEVGIGIRMENPPTTGDFEQYWGYFEMQQSSGTNQQTIENGLMFGRDKDGVFTRIVKSGTEVYKKYAKDWTFRDDSGFDLEDGNIFQIKYSYYGYGGVVFQYLESNDTGDENIKKLDFFQPGKQTTMDNTNLQVGALNKSTNTSEDFSTFVGGRKYCIYGRYNPRSRINGVRNTGVSVGKTGFTPICSLRRKSGNRQIASDLQSFNTLQNNDMVVQLRLNSTLTGATFTALDEQPAGETGLEQDTDATAIDTSTGVKLFETVVPGGGGNKTDVSNISDLPADIPDEGTITLCASAIDTSATVDGVLKLQEIF